MNKTGQRDPRFRGLEKKVGIFVSIAVATLLAIFFFMGKERGLFTQKYNLFFAVDSASGFLEGIPVKLSGFKIGKIKSLALTSDARVRVILEINKEYQKWIREGSVARMLKEGVIGDTVVEVTVGSPAARVIEDGGEITYEKVGGIEELAKEVKPVLQDIKETISYINDPEGDIKKAIANIEKLSEGLLKTKENLDSVLREAKGTVKEATDAFAKLGEVGDKAMPVIDKLNTVASDAETALKKMPEVIDKVGNIMDDVKQFSDVLSRKSHGIKIMLEDTEDMLSNTKEIIKGAKESWPIDSMLPPKEELKLIPLENLEKGY